MLGFALCYIVEAAVKVFGVISHISMSYTASPRQQCIVYVFEEYGLVISVLYHSTISSISVNP